MNRTSCDCRNVGCFEKLEQAGDFYFLQNEHEGGAWYCCVLIPCDDRPAGIHAGIPVNAPGKPYHPKGWNWDGNEQKPTLTPSIFQNPPDGPHSWHGYLTAGRLVSC